MPEDEFTPARDPALEGLDVSTWEPGPLCECDNGECREYLPTDAWHYVASVGQSVVSPLHTQSGVRHAYREGFVIEENTA